MNHLNTLSDAVATHARLSPGKLAVRDSRRSLTFAQWQERTERLAAGLRQLGLEKGDRVAGGFQEPRQFHRIDAIAAARVMVFIGEEDAHGMGACKH